jgi:uncharacterized protein (TIGR01244 family)
MELVELCDSVFAGPLPDDRVVEEAARRGITTFVDTREDGEKAGDGLEARLRGLGFGYVSAPVSRTSITTEQVQGFSRAVLARPAAPAYVFSEGGRRPVGLLLLLSCHARADAVIHVFKRARDLGFPLDREAALKEFILGYYVEHGEEAFYTNLGIPRERR